jgi:putative transposase
MALDHAALLEVLEAMQAAGVDDRVRTAAQTMYQALIDAEVTAVIGAGPWERSAERSAHRNGSRPRTLTTTAGDLELRIPKLRVGSFFPSLLERRRRVDQALFAVIMEAYLHGVSTRKVDDLVQALGGASGISKSEVSRICVDLDEEVGAFRDRSLADVAYPYVFLDATYCKARVNRRVVSQAVVIATGVTVDGRREVLGFDVGDSEDGAFWTAFLRGLKARGLGGVQLVISDAHTGLKAAIGSVLLGAAWQRCRVHFMRNVLGVVPKGTRKWSLPRSARSSPSPTPGTCTSSSRSSPPCSANSFPRSRPCSTTPDRTCSRSPGSPCRIGRRSGQPTPSSGSTRKSNAAPTSSASSPTPLPCYAWPARSWSRHTTNGKSAPNAATCPNTPWPNSPRNRPRR